MDCVGRWNLLGVTNCFLQSRRFLCGGGSLLQNGTGNLSLRYYLGLLRLARLCGCETEFFAGGIGPLRGAWAERAVLRELERCDRIQLRDARSASLLEAWGISAERIGVREDPAMGLSLPPPHRLLYLKKEAGLPLDQPYFCAVVRGFEGKAFPMETLSSVFCEGARKWGVTPVFLIFDTRLDSAVTQEACRLSGGVIPRLREASDALAWIGGGFGAVSMRLHGLIFSATSGVPAVGISPSDAEPKLAAFCAERNFPHLTPSELTSARLAEELERLFGGG